MEWYNMNTTNYETETMTEYLSRIGAMTNEYKPEYVNARAFMEV